MIILSKLADYGVIVASHLAADPDRQETAAAIAAATRLPPATVAKLLKALAHAGLVSATRGAAGGYRLARLPEDCDRTNYCPTRPHWAAINRAVGAALSAVSLDEMIGPLAFAPAMFAEPAARDTHILMDVTPR